MECQVGDRSFYECNTIISQLSLRLVLILALAFLILPFLLSTNLLVTVGFVVAERSLYLSVAGSAIAVVWGWQKMKSKCQV